MGEISKIRIGHDGTGIGSDWYCEAVTIKNDVTDKQYSFPCRQWFGDQAADKQLIRDLVPIGSEATIRAHYKITVKTGDARGSGTDSKVFIRLYGNCVMGYG